MLPSIKFSSKASQHQFPLASNQSHHVLEYIGSHIISNPNSIIHLESFIQSLNNHLVVISPFTESTDVSVTFLLTRDPQFHACLILPSTGATHIVITQALTQSHTQVHVVTVIIKKPHQLPPVTTHSQRKSSP